jgi:hypothetical protein
MWVNLINNNKNKQLKEILKLNQGEVFVKENFLEGQFKVYGNKENKYIDVYNRYNKVVILKTSEEECVKMVYDKFFLNNYGWTIDLLNKEIEKEILEGYVNAWLWYIQDKIFTNGNSILHQSNFLNLNIIIPTLEVQKEIMNEFKYYDEIINKLEKDNEKLEKNKIINIILNSIIKSNNNVEDNDNSEEEVVNNKKKNQMNNII